MPKDRPDYRPDEPAPKRDLFDPTWDPYDLAPPPAPAPIPVAPTAERAKVVQDVAIDLSDNDIYGKWFAFHLNNPHVYKNLRLLALDAHKDRYVFGIAALVEIIRWERRFTTEGEDYKMPNAFRSMYARLLMEQEPILKEFFHTAELRSAFWPTDPSSVYDRTVSVE